MKIAISCLVCLVYGLWFFPRPWWKVFIRCCRRGLKWIKSFRCQGNNSVCYLARGFFYNYVSKMFSRFEMPIILHLDVEAMFLISLFIIVSGFFLAIFFSAKTNERRHKKKTNKKTLNWNLTKNTIASLSVLNFQAEKDMAVGKPPTKDISVVMKTWTYWGGR